MLDLHKLLTLKKFGCIGSRLSEGRKPGIRAFDDTNFLRPKIREVPFHLHTLPSLPNRTWAMLPSLLSALKPHFTFIWPGKCRKEMKMTYQRVVWHFLSFFFILVKNLKIGKMNRTMSYTQQIKKKKEQKKRKTQWHIACTRTHSGCESLFGISRFVISKTKLKCIVVFIQLQWVPFEYIWNYTDLS